MNPSARRRWLAMTPHARVAQLANLLLSLGPPPEYQALGSEYYAYLAQRECVDIVRRRQGRRDRANLRRLLRFVEVVA